MKKLKENTGKKNQEKKREEREETKKCNNCF